MLFVANIKKKSGKALSDTPPEGHALFPSLPSMTGCENSLVTLMSQPLNEETQTLPSSMGRTTDGCHLPTCPWNLALASLPVSLEDLLSKERIAKS